MTSAPSVMPTPAPSPVPTALVAHVDYFYNASRIDELSSHHSYVYLVGLLAAGIGLLFAALAVGMCRIHLERMKLKPPSALEMRHASLDPMSVA